MCVRDSCRDNAGLFFTFEDPLHVHFHYQNTMKNHKITFGHGWNCDRKDIIKWWATSDAKDKYNAVSGRVAPVSIDNNHQMQQDLQRPQSLVIHIHINLWNRDHKGYIRYITKQYNFDYDSIPPSRRAIYGAGINAQYIRDCCKATSHLNRSKAKQPSRTQQLRSVAIAAVKAGKDPRKTIAMDPDVGYLMWSPMGSRIDRICADLERWMGQHKEDKRKKYPPLRTNWEKYMPKRPELAD
eukprot:68041_1